MDGFARVFAAALSDPHTHLADPPEGTPRWPPFDLVVEAEGKGAGVLAVGDGSPAEAAGMTPGVRIVAIDGIEVDKAATLLMPTCLRRPDRAAHRYALDATVSGRRGHARTLELAGARR